MSQPAALDESEFGRLLAGAEDHFRTDTDVEAALARDDIVRQTQLARSWPQFPADAVVIGHDGCGDRLVLLPSGSEEMDIAVWDHETGQLEPVDGDVFDVDREGSGQ